MQIWSSSWFPSRFSYSFTVLTAVDLFFSSTFFCVGKRWCKELGENGDIKRKEKENKELEENGGDYGEIREEEKRSRWSKAVCLRTCLKYLRKREGRRYASSFGFLLRGSLSMPVRLLSFRRVSFILFSTLSIPLSRVVRNSAWLYELWHLESTISQCRRIMKPYQFKNDGSQLMAALWELFMRKWSKF